MCVFCALCFILLFFLFALGFSHKLYQSHYSRTHAHTACLHRVKVLRGTKCLLQVVIHIHPSLYLLTPIYIYDHNCARIHSFTVTELDWGGVGVVMHCKTVT